jgi:hypothetical protein
MNLLREIGRSSRTGVEVKSNKGERTPVGTTVDTDELALAEAHVRSVRKRRGDACGSVRSGPATLDVGQTYEPVEVCDL